jgi:molecular chaperone GrpE
VVGFDLKARAHLEVAMYNLQAKIGGQAMETIFKNLNIPQAMASEVDWLKEELRHEHEMYLRVLADFDNYRRRIERERERAERNAKREVILPLLDVIDLLDLMLERKGEMPQALSEQLQAVHRKLLSVLEAQGVTAFSSLGETFNPHLHEAVGTVESSDYKPGSVADELQRGYRWGDHVLRPAKVKVAQ